MRPVLLKLWGLDIHSYGFMLAVAFFIGIIGVAKSVKRLNIEFDTIVDLGIWVLVGAVAGARIAYILTEYHYFQNYPAEIFRITSGGLAFHGGLAGGFLAGYWFTRNKKIATWKLADAAAPFIALGYSVVRIGCLLNGCCYGKPSAAPWALRCAAGDATLRHPTQLYSMVGSFILFLILGKLRNHRKFPGFLFLLYLGLYSILRFGVEIFREGPMVYPWLSLAQAVCLVLGVTAFGLIGWLERRRQKRGLNLDAASKIDG